MKAKSSIIISSLARILSARPEIAAAYLYGSAARDRVTPLSDVDVGLLFAESVEPRTRRRIASEVASEMARSHPGESVDVRDLEDLPLVVQGHVLSEAALAGSNDERRRVSFEVAIRQRYFDFLPFHRADVSGGLQALRRKLRSG